MDDKTFRDLWEKVHIHVCIPANSVFGESCSTAFAIALSRMEKPPHITFETDEMKPLPVARNKLVRSFIDLKADYLLFIDSDTIPPPDGLKQLFSHIDKFDIVSGLYFRKTEASKYSPVAFPKVVYTTPDGSPAWKTLARWDGSTIPVEAVGMGFCLIPKRVFMQLPHPYFHWIVDNTEGYVREGEKEYINIGEDFYFCNKARQAGFTIGLDTSCLCAHANPSTAITYKHYMDKYQMGELLGATPLLPIITTDQEASLIELTRYFNITREKTMGNISYAENNLLNDWHNLPIEKTKEQIENFYANNTNQIFDQIAHNYFNLKRAASRNKLAEQATGRVLDYGAGIGDLLIKIHNRNPNLELTHYDLSGEVTEFAKWRYDVRKMDIKFELNGLYDTIYCLNTLEHIPNPVDHLKIIKEHAAKNCNLIVTYSLPDDKHPMRFEIHDLGTLYKEAGIGFEQINKNEERGFYEDIKGFDVNRGF